MRGGEGNAGGEEVTQPSADSLARAGQVVGTSGIAGDLSHIPAVVYRLLVEEIARAIDEAVAAEHKRAQGVVEAARSLADWIESQGYGTKLQEFDAALARWERHHD